MSAAGAWPLEELPSVRLHRSIYERSRKDGHGTLRRADRRLQPGHIEQDPLCGGPMCRRTVTASPSSLSLERQGDRVTVLASIAVLAVYEEASSWQPGDERPSWLRPRQRLWEAMKHVSHRTLRCEQS